MKQFYDLMKKVPLLAGIVGACLSADRKREHDDQDCNDVYVSFVPVPDLWSKDI